jgi:hypothetical protein
MTDGSLLISVVDLRRLCGLVVARELVRRRLVTL